MEAFEEWFKAYLDKIDDKWSRLMAKQMKRLYEYAWRAALEWVLSEHGPLGEYNNNCDCARMKVKKELEETQ